MSPCTRKRVNTNNEPTAFSARCSFWTPGPTVRDNSTAHYCVEHRNHPALTHSSKTDWHEPYGIRHPAEQRADYRQEELSTGSLTPALAYGYHFVWRHGNMSPCTGRKVNINYKRINLMCWMSVLNPWPYSLTVWGTLFAHYCIIAMGSFHSTREISMWISILLN